MASRYTPLYNAIAQLEANHQSADLLPAPVAPERVAPPIDGLQEFPFRLFNPKCCKDCWDSDPLCHDTCGEYEVERDAAIRKAEREQVLDEVLGALDLSPFYEGHRWKYQEFLEPLRGDA